VRDAYSALTGISFGDPLLQSVRDSIVLIIESGVDHEFRTTVIKECHSPQDVKAMGEQVKGAKKYYLQGFRPEKTLDPAFASKTAYNDDEMLNLLAGIEGIGEVSIR
jgi:pyruvate formate lyase activating enzyme